jgi:hypothetical protein
MKLRFDTYTKSLNAATETFHDIMSTEKCDDLSLAYNEYNSCYNLMGTIDSNLVDYVSGFLNDGNWNEDSSAL